MLSKWCGLLVLILHGELFCTMRIQLLAESWRGFILALSPTTDRCIDRLKETLRVLGFVSRQR